jgi:hypothetical protein
MAFTLQLKVFSRFMILFLQQKGKHENHVQVNGSAGENTLMSWAKIVDCGNAPLTFLDNAIALKQLDKAHRVCLPS